MSELTVICSRHGQRSVDFVAPPGTYSEEHYTIHLTCGCAWTVTPGGLVYLKPQVHVKPVKQRPTAVKPAV